MNHLVTITRTSGPCTDTPTMSMFTDAELEVVKDTIAIVNRVTGGKEGWCLVFEDQSTVVPECKK